MKFDIITLGSATVDYFIYTDAELIELKNMNFDRELLAYPLGSKILIKELHTFTGGGGTNTAVGFSRLGLKTGFIGNIGSDNHAELILKELKKEKVKFLGTKSEKYKTGFSIVLDSFVDDRTILVYKGANDFLNFNKVKERIKDVDTKALYVSSLVRNSFNAGVRLIKYFKKKGVIIFYNPSSYVVSLGLNKLLSYIAHIDFLIVNKEEGQTLLNIKERLSLKELCEEVFKKTGKPVCVTDGKNGAAFFAGKRFFKEPTQKVNVKEKTGAGDAFSVGFVYGILKGKDYDRCLKYGIRNAESVIQKIGAKNRLLCKL